MQRRDFIVLVGGTTAAGFSALAAQAQQSTRQRRIATAIPGWGEDIAYGAAFDSVQKARSDLLLVSDEPQHISNSRALVSIATNAQIPAMYPFRDIAVAGGLM